MEDAQCAATTVDQATWRILGDWRGGGIGGGAVVAVCEAARGCWMNLGHDHEHDYGGCGHQYICDAVARRTAEHTERESEDTKNNR